MTELPADVTGRFGYMGPGDVAFLRWVAQVPGVVGSLLNVGCYRGLSCSVLATAGEGPLVCVDPFGADRNPADPTLIPATYEEWDRNMWACGVRERIVQFRGRSVDVLPQLKERGMAFRVALVDGSHAYEDCRSDVAWSMLLLSPGGLLVLDDYRSFPGIARAVDESGLPWTPCGDKMAYVVRR